MLRSLWSRGWTVVLCHKHHRNVCADESLLQHLYCDALKAAHNTVEVLAAIFTDLSGRCSIATNGEYPPSIWTLNAKGTPIVSVPFCSGWLTFSLRCCERVKYIWMCLPLFRNRFCRQVYGYLRILSEDQIEFRVNEFSCFRDDIVNVDTPKGDRQPDSLE